MISEKKYMLSPGTQVRQEDFGLLFYTMKGPRLYFLPLKQWIEPLFFQGQYTLTQWVEEKGTKSRITSHHFENIEICLEKLRKKGVILEC